MFDFKVKVKIQRKILLIYQTDFIFALISRHLIVESSSLQGRGECTNGQIFLIHPDWGVKK